MTVNFKTTIMGIALLGGVGCASTPDFNAVYYTPKATLDVKLIQTAGCSVATVTGDDGKIRKIKVPHLTSELKPTVTYSSDYRYPYYINLSDLDSQFANSDITLDYRKDGRLSGMEVTQVGQGSEIVKAALNLVGTAYVEDGTDAVCDRLQAFEQGVFQITRHATYDIAALSQADAELDAVIASQPGAIFFDDEGNELKGCDRLKAAQNHEEDKDPETDKPKPVPEHTLSCPHDLSSASIDQQNWRVLRDIFGKTDVDFNLGSIVGQPIGPIGSSDTAASLVLMAPKEAVFSVLITPQIVPQQTYTAGFLAPSLGEPYALPLQKAPWFGTNRITLTLAESGMIRKLKYGADSGVASAFGAAQSVIDEFDGPTAQERLDELTLENNIRAQQAREMLCLTTPEECK